jgi:hypothetical protein
VVDELLLVYLSGWVVTTLGALVAARRLGDEGRPAPHPLGVSVLAGAFWPLLLVGVLELTSVIVAAKVRLRREPGIAIFV